MIPAAAGVDQSPVALVAGFSAVILTLCCLYRVGAELIIRLKWGQTEYKGKLESIDSYMNVLLRDTEEFIDGKNTGSLGLVLIRWVSGHSIPLLYHLHLHRMETETLLWLWGLRSIRMFSFDTSLIVEKNDIADLFIFRCNNILWMASADGVEMTDLGLK